MKGFPRALVALLVVVAATTAAVPVALGDSHDVAQVRPQPSTNTTSVLLLPRPTTTGFDTGTVDVGPALDATWNVGSVATNERILDNRLSEADSVSRRRQILRQETERLTNVVQSLQSAERTALAAYENNTISETELLRRLAVVDAGARRADVLAERLQGEVAQTQFLSSTEAQLQTLRIRLTTLQGPVRQHVRQVFRGEADPTRVHVTVSGDAIALAMVDGSVYVREATEPSNLNESEVDNFGSESEIIARISELYPWAWGDETISSQRTYTNFKNGFYRIDVSHNHGELTAYIDGTTEQVFREVQTKSLGRTPTGPAVGSTDNGTTLTVYRSFVGGPVLVETTDGASEPVATDVYVSGELVGRTGADGRLWTLSPKGQFTVNAVRDAGNVSITTRPSS